MEGPRGATMGHAHTGTKQNKTTRRKGGERARAGTDQKKGKRQDKRGEGTTKERENRERGGKAKKERRKAREKREGETDKTTKCDYDVLTMCHASQASNPTKPVH